MPIPYIMYFEKKTPYKISLAILKLFAIYINNDLSTKLYTDKIFSPRLYFPVTSLLVCVVVTTVGRLFHLCNIISCYYFCDTNTTILWCMSS
jgi:hypothetical protein